MFIFNNPRFSTIAISFGISIAILLTQYQPNTGNISHLTQMFGLLALLFLYLTILASPLIDFYPRLPFKNFYTKIRPSLGLSTFYFATIHASLAFFGQLGGFSGISFLTNSYLFSLGLGFAGLFILLVLSLTTFNLVKDGFIRFRKLQILIYLAAFLVTIHALMLGGHFTNYSEIIPQIFMVMLVFLLSLEAVRADKYLKQKFGFLPSYGIIFSLLIISISVYVSSQLLNKSSINLSIHSEHQKIAADLLKSQTSNSKNPQLLGDRTKRFNVIFSYPESVLPNEEVSLKFKITDAGNGSDIALFQKIYDKTMHLIIVDNSLDYYQHLHPTQVGDSFFINTSFPKSGNYHLYLDFQPAGAIEQQFGFILPVGSLDSVSKPSQLLDKNFSKNFDNYQVTLNFNQPLSSERLSLGRQALNFVIKDKDDKPVTTLFPYLGAFGHLVMINMETFDYIHVHPATLKTVKPEERGGPEVSFLPIGIYGPIKPGKYRIFGQFNPDGNLITTDYTVEVK